MSGVSVISDPGVDDAVALVLLDKLAQKQSKLLLATFGNNTAAITTKNAVDFSAYMQGDWAFRPGATLPLSGQVERAWPDYFHGPDGLWGVRPPAGTRPARRSNRQVDSRLFSLSPLTEAYACYQSGRVKELMIMGGAFNEPGNETPYAETNIAFDPDAAQLLLANCQDIVVNIVPLDVTRKAVWSWQQVQAIPETNTTNRWLKRLITAWFEGYNHEKEKDFNLHDPLAVFLYYYPQYALWRRSGVEVVTVGKKRGQTVWSKVNPPCNVAIDLHDPAAVSRAIYSLLFLEQNA
jgi:inosine-uridine nucleoside N-ribohydrolase